MLFLSTDKAGEEEKRGTVSMMRKSPKKSFEIKSHSCSKKRKNDSFETEKQGDMDIIIDENENDDDDLSDDSDDRDLCLLQVI